MEAQREFKLNAAFIELDNLLKIIHLAPSGGEAKRMIRAGSIKVNGEIESKVRRKLHAGDAVEFNESKISVT